LIRRERQISRDKHFLDGQFANDGGTLVGVQAVTN
jgi:hypothetical protein